MAAIKGLNLALAFLLELALLAACAVATWALTGDAGWPTAFRVAAAVALPLAIAVLWGLWLAPRSETRFPAVWRVVTEVVLFGLGTWLLVLADKVGWGIALAVLAAVNITAAVVWRQE